MESWRNNSNMKNEDIPQIDLTLSSPEPETRPRLSQRPKPQDFGGPVKRENGRSLQRKRPPFSRPQPAVSRLQANSSPAVTLNVEHLIDSSHPSDLKEVLLELCKLSPNLAGALSRGLVYKSRTQSQCPNATTDLITSSARTAPSSRAPGRVPDVKIESRASRPPSPGSSDISDSDLFAPQKSVSQGTATPGPYGPSTPRSRGSNYQNSSGDAVAGPSSLSTSHSYGNRPGLPDRLARAPEKNCKNCRQPFAENSNDDCWYHPGQKKMVTDITTGTRRVQYSCCAGDQYDPPCTNGEHIYPTTSALDQLKRPQY